MILRSRKLKKDFELKPGTTTFGRRTDRDVKLTGSSVSGEHAVLQLEDGLVQLRDISRNGVLLNGVRIPKSEWTSVNLRDEIVICGVDFRLLENNSGPDDSSSCFVDDSNKERLLTDGESKSISLSRSESTAGKEYSRLKALVAITSTLRDVLHTDEMLELAVEKLFEILPAINRAAIGFLEPNGTLTPKWWKVDSKDPDPVIQISSTIVQHVSQTSSAVASADALKDFDGAESVAASSMRSVMAAPLIDDDDNVFGVIHVDAKLPGMFTELDLEILAAVAIQIGMAVTVSRLHESAVTDALLRQDMEHAAAVQKSILPSGPPVVQGYELTGFYRPARDVGGDYIDYIWMPNGKLAIVLGDVVGKGVPAALTMVRLATETRVCLETDRMPSEIVTRLNQRFPDNFITFVILVLDPLTHTITFCNAGQETPLYRRANGTVETIGFDEAGCPIGVLESETYVDVTIPFQSGESIVAFSDGFPDAQHSDGEQRHGAEPIAKHLHKSQLGASEFVDFIVQRVDEFMGDSRQFDDMAMVCLRRV